MRKTRVSIRSFHGSLLMLVFVAACDRVASTAEKVGRTDSAGIAIVLNGAEDRPLSWQIEPVHRIGGSAEGPEGFFELGEWLVDTDPAGRIYVLDAANTRVVVFDSSGTHLRSLGGRGAGPGEMREPMAISVDGEGTVNVADFARETLLRWDAGGRLLPGADSLRLLPLTSKPFAADARGFLVVVEEAAGAEDSVSWRLVRHGDGPSVPIAVAARRRTRPMDIGCAMGLFAPLFSSDLVWEAKGGRLAIATGGEYEIRLLEAQGERRIRRPLPLRAASRELALKEAGRGLVTVGFRTMKCRLPAELRVDRQGYQAVVPAISDLEIAWDGELWVERTALHGEPRAIDIFDPSGAYVGTLPPASPFPVAFLPDGMIIAIERDAMDVQRLVIYSIVRDGP